MFHGGNLCSSHIGCRSPLSVSTVSLQVILDVRSKKTSHQFFRLGREMPKFHVKRSISIDASPEKVFEIVSDYSTWTTWSPWLCAEPDAKVTVSKDPASVGSTYAWEGEITGAGEMEHLRLEPGQKIEDEIRFLKPFKSTSSVSFDIDDADGKTSLTWHMRGAMPWYMFWMVPMMETFIGMDYERGLKMLKEWIETGEIESKTNIRGVESIGPLRMLGVRKQCTFDNIGSSMESAFKDVAEKLAQHNIQVEGEGISVYHHMDAKARTFDYTSGFLVPDSIGEFPADFSTWSIPKVQALVTEHVGRYDHLGNAWSAANQHARYKKLKQSKAGAFEVYKNNCDSTPPAELRTVIYLPLK